MPPDVLVLVPVEETLTVGSTTTSPAFRPATICVVELPTRPTTTGCVVWMPWLRTVTVDLVPVVVTAADGTMSTSVFEAVMTVTSAVMPTFTAEGGSLMAIVTS